MPYHTVLAPCAEPASDGRLSITPADLAACFNTEVTAQTRLTALVSVDYRGEATSTCCQVPSADGHTLVEAAYLDVWLADHPYERARLDSDAATLERHHRRVLAELATVLPTAVLHPGADSASALRQGLHWLGQ